MSGISAGGSVIEQTLKLVADAGAFKDRLKQIAEAEAGLDETSTKVREQQRALNAERAQLDADKAAFARASSTFQAAKTNVETTAAAFTQREADVSKRERDVAAAAIALAASRTAQEKQIADKLAELNAKLEDCARRETRVAALEREAAQVRAALDGKLARLRELVQ
jgi:chromosome segregation ATPase